MFFPIIHSPTSTFDTFDFVLDHLNAASQITRLLNLSITHCNKLPSTYQFDIPSLHHSFILSRNSHHRASLASLGLPYFRILILLNLDNEPFHIIHFNNHISHKATDANTIKVT